MISEVSLPYQQFDQIKNVIAGVEPIDYFFAKQFTSLLTTQATINVNTYIPELFHLLVAANMSLRDGHSCLPLSSVANQQLGYACEDNGVISHQGFLFSNVEHLRQLLDQFPIGEECQQAVVFYNDSLYLRRYFVFEQQVLKFINDASIDEFLPSQTHSVVNEQSIKACLSLLFNDSNSDDIDWQKIAVANALNKRFSIIAGGPGTGKTYTVTKLLAALIMLDNNNDLSISLVAPTGKAAQRLSESIINAVNGFKDTIDDEILNKIPTIAQTIHRLLGVVPNSPNFRFNQSHLLNTDVLIIDEVSMVDLPLMARTFRALPHHCRVILLGDADQLPSVAAGSILADLSPLNKTQFSRTNQQYLTNVTDCHQLTSHHKHYLDHLTYLTKSRRFDGQGGIGVLARAVIKGESTDSWQLLKSANRDQNSQLELIEQSLTDSLKPLVDKYYRPLSVCKTVAEAFKCFSRFRILSATKVGDVGVDALNKRVESLLNSSNNGPFVKSSLSMTKGNSQTLYHGMPIMITENDYSLGLYNGDIGFIWRNDAGNLMAYFEQEGADLLTILPARLPTWVTVYAMTIHKTQGSEFAHVMMVLPNKSEYQLLSRELLYTGITRAKNKISIHSKENVWLSGVEGKISRYSGIKLLS